MLRFNCNDEYFAFTLHIVPRHENFDRDAEACVI